MIQLDHRFLVQLGLGHLEPEQQRVILQKLYEVLELRVSQALTASLTKGELKTFERLVDESDEASAQEYLQRVVPDYGVVVRSELDYIAGSLQQSMRHRTVMVGAGGGQAEND